MTKNGTFFISIVERDQFTSSIWDPYFYRMNGLYESLGDYMTVTKPRRYQNVIPSSPFCPIEYRHIPKGKYLTFMLEFCQDDSRSTSPMVSEQLLLFGTMRTLCRDYSHPKYPVIGEQQLLFGTMRAYLGNVLVTPEAEWIDCESPLFFPVKSEFVCVFPKDKCIYFWWAYLRSANFLRNLPLGSGGTRPRLHEEGLLQTPVKIPEIELRQFTHEKLRECAEREWKEYTRRMRIISSVNL